MTEYEFGANGVGQEVVSKWVCEDTSNGEVFELDRTGWSYQDFYTNLIKVLEKMTGKKGLTIVID